LRLLWRAISLEFSDKFRRFAAGIKILW
jgi:hypothetical protein